MLVVVLLILAMITDRLITASEDKEFRTRFAGVEMGMSETSVLSMLGSPDNHSVEFYLSKQEGFEEAYMRAATSAATNYLMWHRGVDVVYAIGLNNEGFVTVMETDGT